jgi:hypothetical protein
VLRTVIGDYESGQLDLRSDDSGTWISVHWSADRDLDEWIEVSLTLSNKDEAEISGANGVFSVGTPENSLQLLNFGSGRFLLRCKGANSIGLVEADLVFDEETRAKLLDHFAQVLTSQA